MAVFEISSNNAQPLTNFSNQEYKYRIRLKGLLQFDKQVLNGMPFNPWFTDHRGFILEYN